MDDEKLMKLMARGKSDKGKDNKKYGKFSIFVIFSHCCSYKVTIKKLIKFLARDNNEDDLMGSTIC